VLSKFKSLRSSLEPVDCLIPNFVLYAFLPVNFDRMTWWSVEFVAAADMGLLLSWFQSHTDAASVVGLLSALLS